MVLLLAYAILRGVSAPIDWPELTSTEIATGASRPVHVTHSSDGSGRLFVVEQVGRILVTTSNGFAATPFLDISERASYEFGSEDGLLNLVFPTNYAASGRFYVYYTRTGDLASAISRFAVSTNSNVADPNSEEQILVIPEITHHMLNGGMLAFGPDGYLYIGTGDNAYSSDVETEAQKPSSLWGKILRIDVNSSPTGYVVPPGNPFVGHPAYAPEIWALGLRNPFRFSFDRANGDLYISDVGHFTAEEIDYEPAPSAGGRNYGWRTREGIHDSYPHFGPREPFVDPIFEALHLDLTVGQAIVGGYVYRGPSQARMNGMYFFADVFSGLIQGMIRSNGVWRSQPLLQTQLFLSSFGEDEVGNLYATDYISGGLYRIDDSGRTRAPAFGPAGPVSDTDLITVASLSPGAVIHFTTDGSDPGESDPAVGSGATVAITSGATLKARAFRTNLQPSEITTQTYSLEAAKPVFAPNQGPLTNNTPVAIASDTPNSVIRFTLDASNPDSNSPIYSDPIQLVTNQTLQARAFRTGFTSSDVAAFHAAPLCLINLSPLTWSSTTGRTYRVQYSLDLRYWVSFGLPVPSQGILTTYPYGTLQLNPNHGFYRVVAE